MSKGQMFILTIPALLFPHLERCVVGSGDDELPAAVHLDAADRVTVPDHGHATGDAGPRLLDVQVPDLDGQVGAATHQPVSLQVETPHLARVTR